MSKYRLSQAQKKLIVSGSLFANLIEPSVFEPSPAYSAMPAAKRPSSLRFQCGLARPRSALRSLEAFGGDRRADDASVRLP
jgi:hypothetical protein